MNEEDVVFKLLSHNVLHRSCNKVILIQTIMFFLKPNEIILLPEPSQEALVPKPNQIVTVCLPDLDNTVKI